MDWATFWCAMFILLGAYHLFDRICQQRKYNSMRSKLMAERVSYMRRQRNLRRLCIIQFDYINQEIIQKVNKIQRKETV